MEFLLMPGIGLLRRPDLRRENLCLLILHDALAPRRDALALAARPLHLHLVEITMLHGIGRQLQLPIARIPDLLAAVMLLLLPAVEIADEEDIQRMWRPLAEHPAVLRPMQAVVLMPVREIRQAALAARQLPDFPHRMVVSPADRILIRLQPRIPCHQTNMFLCTHLTEPLST